MALKRLFFVALFALVVLSCSKDDEPKNNAPTIADKAFTVKENIAGGDPIGTLTASDKDGDALTFSIAANDNALFAITAKGALSLATGKSLDFETAAKHTISVSVNDGEATAKATITINVEEVPNNAPEVAESELAIDVLENISDTAVIVEIEATDKDGDELSFAITDGNGAGLFEVIKVEGKGHLSLAAGKTLDFEAQQSHAITIGVGDGKDTTLVTITITVKEVNENSNNPPVAQDQAFEVAEDQTEIGTVAAEDAEGDDISFQIIENDFELFQITQTGGVLSLADGKSLDYETNQTHTIKVYVSDNWATTTITITINVTNVVELAESELSFVTKWKTTTPDEEVIIGTGEEEYVFNYTIDWGDGTVQQLNTPNPLHTYTTPGTYVVAIQGQFPAFGNDNEGLDIGTHQCISMEQWGAIVWKNLDYAFLSFSPMEYNATDIPNLDEVESVDFMFGNGEISYNNNSIKDWDVSNVEDMDRMFAGASNFNIDISSWDVSMVTDMSYMFYEATSFNQPIGNWGEKTNQVINMTQMFGWATSFDQPIDNWNVSNVISMLGMFQQATSFDQPIGNWNVSNVTNMSYMFNGATSFNQNISGWDVSKVSNMFTMFQNAEKFDQNLGDWDISSITVNMSAMLDNTGLSTQNYGATLVGWATQEPGEGPIPTGIVLNASGLEYCSNDSEVTVARNNLLGAPLNWDIQGDTGITCNDL